MAISSAGVDVSATPEVVFELSLHAVIAKKAVANTNIAITKAKSVFITKLLRKVAV